MLITFLRFALNKNKPIVLYPGTASLVYIKLVTGGTLYKKTDCRRGAPNLRF